MLEFPANLLAAADLGRECEVINTCIREDRLETTAVVPLSAAVRAGVAPGHHDVILWLEGLG